MKLAPGAKITEHRSQVKACASKFKTNKLPTKTGEEVTNLGDVRVPIDVADVVVGQASEEIDEVLQKKWDVLNQRDRNADCCTFFQQVKILTTSQLGRFCTDTHKLINSSSHNLSEKQRAELVIFYPNFSPRLLSVKRKLLEQHCFLFPLSQKLISYQDFCLC